MPDDPLAVLLDLDDDDDFDPGLFAFEGDCRRLRRQPPQRSRTRHAAPGM
jgi:hypothetical protein